ncbi:hypothetical protein GL4_1486 [Methyloceanibacter caenitepidi]|uniref:Uncharacterized protein n=1 Tax=Methyloceanibacter caenitepidi TaxID=1384459 RepID=A0A0A8K340_9HYPH|nr:hypothetical protein GL4_1486 [Methyloceanibacter caenitepidi]
MGHTPPSEAEIYRKALRDIRNKVHAHNRGGELYAGLRDVLRDICDDALARGEQANDGGQR